MCLGLQFQSVIGREDVSEQSSHIMVAGIGTGERHKEVLAVFLLSSVFFFYSIDASSLEDSATHIG